jgi:hypothetical protein
MNEKSETVGSASDERIVNNTMRHKYRVLSDDEKAAMLKSKDLGLAAHEAIQALLDSPLWAEVLKNIKDMNEYMSNETATQGCLAKKSTTSAASVTTAFTRTSHADYCFRAAFIHLINAQIAAKEAVMWHVNAITE